jgi:hypothetical protein
MYLVLVDDPRTRRLGGVLDLARGQATVSGSILDRSAGEANVCQHTIVKRHQPVDPAANLPVRLELGDPSSDEIRQRSRPESCDQAGRPVGSKFRC